MSFSKKAFSSYLEEGEEIIQVIHHSIFTIFKPIAIIVAIFHLLPLLGWYFFENLALIWLILIIIGFSKIISRLAGWYFNALLVTSMSLLNVEWTGVFNRQATRIEYSQVDAFSYAVMGVFNTVFNFGDLIIDKVGGGQVIIKGAFRPKYTTQYLSEMQSQMVDQQLKKDHESLKGVLTDMLRSHISTHGVVISDE
jgi:hypothetical protein